MNLLLFEDAVVDRLHPVTTGRPAWSVSCASYRLIDLVRKLGDTLCSVDRPFLKEIVAVDFTDCIGDLDPAKPWTLCINARTSPSLANLEILQNLSASSAAVHCCEAGTLQAAVVPTRQLVTEKLDVEFWNDAVPQIETSTAMSPALELFNHLHDYVRINGQVFLDNMNDRLRNESWHEVADGIFSPDPQWQLPDNVSCNTQSGPILVSSECQIRPFVALEGPLYLGPNNRIAEHSSIRECVATGTTCKLGGEIEASVIESFSNKQHYGFLGHSYLGSWINLGAGTCNSDLKNTYGTVNMRCDGERIATGMQFVGCFIGDYARTAINTSIFTGKRIGACSMVYGVAHNDVAAFTNHARSLGQVTAIDPGVIIQTQARMFARRDISQRPCDAELISSMFDRTAGQRQGLPTEPLSW